MEWQKIFIGFISIILSALFAWGIERLIEFLNSRIKDEKARKYVVDAIGIVTNAVKATYQTYVEVLKGRDAFTIDAQKEALHRAIVTVRAQLNSDAKRYITDNYGDLDAWIANSIEAVLYDLKK